MSDKLDAELREAYRAALSGQEVTVSGEAFTRLYRMAYFHIPVPKFLNKLRERLS